ncbi:dihydroxyacetone kinase subunit DhaL [Euzebya tangerina]|uniref:dihydroxyacetone kinase subunit DhaL n=1 Tax=Euzebya tangerina TaxID=591198 RepID=UPI000E31A6D5|nr:dihydroxyacetone kinase subunit DhaL [Euzebya tangerina]
MPDDRTATAAALLDWVRVFATRVEEHKQELTRLDSAIGDADHGINMQRGMAAVMESMDELATDDVAKAFGSIGMTLVSKVGGASGPLYGTFFLRLGTTGGAVDALDAAALGKALRAGLEGVIARGKAEVGDKTMIDALTPAVDAFDAAVAEGADLAVATTRAAEAAAGGREATRDLLARKGRASYLGERSIGHIDPGAASAALLMEALAAALGTGAPGTS